MPIKIRRAAVLGAGVMGAQIAAHLAAAGVRVHLLDLASDEALQDPKQAKLVGKHFRSARAKLAIAALAELKPSPLASPSVTQLIIPGNFSDDWSVLADADWVIEAVVERLDIKTSIHKRIAEVVRPHVPVTTNTSGISLAQISKDLPDTYARQFFATHFFNPPRYMKLVEVIKDEQTDDKLAEQLAEWISERLGKGIVWATDHINFIANRLGVLAIQSVIKHMQDLNVSMATVDAVTGPLIGRPKSATFRTMDVVGLDTLVHVANNVHQHIKDDPYYSYFATPAWLQGLLDKKMLGLKTPSGGCYQKSKNKKGETVFLTYDYKAGQHVDEQPENLSWLKDAMAIKDLAKRLQFIFSQKDHVAQLIWLNYRDVFSYAALLVETIASGSPKAVDDAMRWGFNWDMGPFELWQSIGVDLVLARMQADKAPLPSWVKPGIKFYEYQTTTNERAKLIDGPSKELSIPQLKMRALAKPGYAIRAPQFQNKEDPRIILSNASASLFDIGDGIACLSFHSKMNTLNDEIVDMVQQSVAKVDSHFSGLVIANDGPHFSAGANLAGVLQMIEAKDFSSIDRLVRNFQGSAQLLKFAPFPTVAAVHGLCLGGGCEVALQTDGVLANLETYAGLVEVGVGLVPAGGGCKELALRAYANAATGDNADPMPFLQRAFMLIGMARTSSSGREAVEMGLFAPQTLVNMSRDHQIMQAKLMVQHKLAMGYAAPQPAVAVKVPGDAGVQTFKLMLYNMTEGKQVSSYDAHLGEQVATILCGGTVDSGTLVSEQQFLDLERLTFVELCKNPLTKDRIAHMLTTGKPLRN